MLDSVRWVVAGGDCSIIVTDHWMGTVMVVRDTIVATFCYIPHPNRWDAVAATLGIRYVNVMGITERTMAMVLAVQELPPLTEEIPLDLCCNMRFAFVVVLYVCSESLLPSQSSSSELSQKRVAL